MHQEKNEQSISEEELVKVFDSCLRIIWIISGVFAVIRLGWPQLQMSLGKGLFIYSSSSSSFIGFCFINGVVGLDYILRKITTLKRLIVLGLSFSSMLVLFFILSFFLSFSKLSNDLMTKHIDLNEYRRCADGRESGHKTGFFWIVAAKQISDCSRLTGTNIPIWSMKSRYKAYKKAIEALDRPSKLAKSDAISTKKERQNVVPAKPVQQVLEQAEEETEISEVVEQEPLPTFKVSHRLLYYGEGEVMIKNFNYLPKSVMSEINEVRREKPTDDYKRIDLTKYLPEILDTYAMSKYKGIHGKGEVTFKFSNATLIHSLSKGDCFNYPDTYISLVSNDFKKVINGKEVVGYPEREFIVFPEASKKIVDKDLINTLNQKMSHVISSSGPDSDAPEYYQVKDKVYALIGELGMGLSYDVFECSEKCLKADYYLDYPPCGS